MKDLLKEDDFITPKYDPWRRFCWFYVGNFMALMSYIAYNYFVPNTISGFINMLFILGVPICLSFFMILGKKEVSYLSFKTILLGIFLGMMLCAATIAMLGILSDGNTLFSGENLTGVLSMFLFYLLIFVVVSFIILMIVGFKREKKNRPR